jgi:hypothetical protein
MAAVASSEEPVPLVDGDHYRQMAGRLRELARSSRPPGIRRELVDLASATIGAAVIFDRRPR